MRDPGEVVVCFDLDGVICENNGGDYANAQPIPLGVQQCNEVYDAGYKVVIFTARGGNRFPGRQYQAFYELTLNWLRAHGVKHHELVLGKPAYDVVIDDKAVRVQGHDPSDWVVARTAIENARDRDQYNQPKGS